jgi:nucleotide-binding universal stress UspA family protein
MSFRVIHLPLGGKVRDAVAIEAALAITRRFEAQLTALFVRVDPSEVVPFIGEGVSPAVIQQLTDAAREETARQRDAARQMLEDACASAGFGIADESAGSGRAVRWLEVSGDRGDLVMKQARLADLTVFARPAEDETTARDVIEATLLGSGRPVLLVPEDWSGSIGHRVAVAWNGGLESARAVNAAMPFLEAADATHVLTARTAKTAFEVSADLAAYLSQHGVSVERHAVKSDGTSVGAALLRHAVEAGADLLVLGGYSRSRFREMVLGGVTHHVLHHARLPVLLAH